MSPRPGCPSCADSAPVCPECGDGLLVDMGDHFICEVCHEEVVAL